MSAVTKAEYIKARRLIRDNGYFALKWLTADVRATFERLRSMRKADDLLADRAQLVKNMGRGRVLLFSIARHIRATNDAAKAI